MVQEQNRMSDLPVRAKVFLVSVYTAGIVSVIGAALAMPALDWRMSWWELLVFVFLAVAAGSRKVHLMYLGPDNESGSMSLGFAMIFATMLRFGPPGALIAGLASTLSSCLPSRQPSYQLLFNLSLNAVQTTLASVVFLSLNGDSLTIDFPYAIPA